LTLALLLKSGAGASPVANLGILFGLSGVPGIGATLDMRLELQPPNSVELQSTNTQDIHFGLTSIPLGFLSRSANVDSRLDLVAAGGFGEHATFAIQMGLAGSVGTSFTSSANLGIVMGLTGSLTGNLIAAPDIQLGLSGAPTISGGTLTPAANVGMTLGLTSTLPAFAAQANISLNFNLASVPGIAVPNLATDMRLSFATDEIRLFFRKG